MSREAQVTFKDKAAGRLEETVSGGSRFVYHESWTTPIACCFPVTRREHEWPAGLHPFFQHLGAEGWLRDQRARIDHTPVEDDFGLLVRYGADCIGAVGVLPVGEAATTPFANEAANPGRTVSGVQRKLLLLRDEAANAYRPAGSSGPAPYIAKFNSPDLTSLVRNEFLSLRWASDVLGKDEVTEFRLDQVAGLDEQALIVTRFDRLPDGSKLRAEDFAQILCKPRGADYGGKYEAGYEDAAQVVRTHSARAEIDLARFFRRLIVFALVSNGDAHLKNFTLLEQPEGLRLSPVYDVVNVAVYADLGYTQRFGLAIGGEELSLDAITHDVLAAFGERIGLSRAAINRSFAEIKTKAKAATKRLPNPQDDDRDPFGASYAELVRNQCAKLLGE